MNNYDELSQVVECKYCKGLAIYGEMIWLNGKCMCPRCYLKEKQRLNALYGIRKGKGGSK